MRRGRAARAWKGWRSRPRLALHPGALAWVVNPYAAGLLIPAAHLWLFAAAGWRARVAVVALLVGLSVPVLALVHLGLALDLDPLEFGWGVALARHDRRRARLDAAVRRLLAAFAGVVRVLLARRRIGRVARPGGAIRTRGPVTYAGPGSLGGTESALRR